MNSPEALQTELNDSKKPSWAKGFWSLIIVQFQGAFSDNVFKFLVLFLISGSIADAVLESHFPGGQGIPQEIPADIQGEIANRRDPLISVVLAVFSIPFILFSMAAGFLADRFPKPRVVRATKLMEVGIMSLGTIGLFLQNIPLLIGVLFLMSVQSAFFGPAKYGLLPELLPEWKLSWGNGFLGLGTFLAIITGGILAGILSDWLGNEYVWQAGVFLIGLAVIGLAFTWGIPKLKAANPEKKFRINFLADLWFNLKQIRKDRVLSLALIGSVYFWFIAALFGEPTVLVYGMDLLDLTNKEIGLLRASLAVGIAVGSVTAGILSARKVEYGLIPLGTLGMASCAALLAWPGLSFAQVSVLLVMMGFFGGFFDIPIMALLQQRPDAKDKGSVLATNGWFTSLGVFVSSLFFWLLRTGLGLEPTTIFLVGATTTFLGTIYALTLVPDAFMRLIIWMLTHTFYRVRVRGIENIPEKGGALFVANHMSLADAFFVIASTDRQIRFMMHREMYDKWWIRPFARMLRVIPIASDLRPREMIKSLQAATDWIKQGNVACIFAEGQISRVGQTLPFRKGMQRILKGVDAPIVPIHLDNVWGSIFSFERGVFYWKIPHQIPYPITVSYGRSMPPESDPNEVRKVVIDLGSDAWEERKSRMPTVQRALIQTARNMPFRVAAADATTKGTRFMSALSKSIFLRNRLAPLWKDQDKVGILLPPSVFGALVNWAALLMGKSPVNLNYTLTQEGLNSCIQQCAIKNVVTSQKLLDRLKFELTVPVLTLEKIAAQPSFLEKMTAFLLAWVCPTPLLEKTLLAEGKRRAVDNLATVIFSSGSTGEPKGVMLSHYNAISNVQQMNQVFAFQKDDRILGVLPFFHSFGFAATLVAPAVLGVGVVYHSNPTESKVIGPLVQEHKVTFLLATPTFLQLYMRGCQPGHFGSLRFAIVGAEKLPERLAVNFENSFGIRPLEAYGCTECSPGVTVNTHNFREAGIHQVGGKRGSIGHPLPGMTTQIVDPDTLEPLPLGQPGLLLVKGPNVMQGYLGQPELTRKVLTDGWYNTGDIASQDEDGFITITDRLSRFSKIGGEMVPHIKVEEKLHEIAKKTEQSFAVTCVPDQKKGEKLAVVHTLPDAELASVMEKLSSADLPNLWKPKKDQFIAITSLPCLGTGKLDLRALKAIAAEKLGSEP